MSARKGALASWDDIRFFLAIHRAGSLSAAAGPLEVTQPTCGRRLAVALSAPSMQVTGAAIAAGLGLGVLPKRAARLFPALHPLSPVVAQATGWLIVAPNLRRMPRVRAVIDVLASAYRADPTVA